MKVLVLGASGFIGFPVAQALSRAGHVVYGQTRSEEKAKRLAAEEIFPVVGELNSEKWHHLIATIDVVVEAIGGEGRAESPKILSSLAAVAKSTRPAGAPKVSFIYTSGTWVHGDNGREIISDTTPITKSVELVEWRAGYEQQVINSQDVRGIVIRPSVLYGRSGSIIGMLFDRLKKTGKVTWPGKPGGRLPLIHQDDLADLYVRAAERAPVIGGLIFDASNPVTESTDALLQRLVELTGVEGPYEYTEPQNLFEVALTTQAVVQPYLARSLLDWHPRKPGLTDGLSLYYNAYLATVNKI